MRSNDLSRITWTHRDQDIEDVRKGKLPAVPVPAGRWLVRARAMFQPLEDCILSICLRETCGPRVKSVSTAASETGIHARARECKQIDIAAIVASDGSSRICLKWEAGKKIGRAMLHLSRTDITRVSRVVDE